MIVAVAAVALAAPTIADMKGHHRVLIVSAPRRDDPALAAQRRALSGWREGAADHDVAIVEVVANRVAGARDTAPALRVHYRLDPRRFGVVLIGKDGHVALRAVEPVRAERLQAAIDAMPMRRAGER